LGHEIFWVKKLMILLAAEPIDAPIKAAAFNGRRLAPVVPWQIGLDFKSGDD
jgi:hypothetical protein